MARRDEDDGDEDRGSRRNKKRGPSKDDKQMAMFCHLGALMGFVIPLIIWMMKKEESRFVDFHGKEAINFTITMAIGHVLGICTFGILNLILWVVSIIFCINAGMAANRGEKYRYGMAIRFIK